MSPPVPPSKWLVTATVLFYMVAALSMVIANKWVLNTTEVPLFFLCMQMVIASILFLACHGVGLFRLPFNFDLALLKGLTPMVSLAVFSLCFSNFTLKYVDASFYQVARGLVLPFTVLTSFLWLSAHPSSKVLLACSLVTLGFLVGVFLDGVHVSFVGVAFGIAGSATSAVHAVVIKKSIKLLDDSALALGWYTNVLSAVVLSVVCLLAGEGPAIVALFSSPVAGAGIDSEASYVLGTFLWGTAVTGVFGFLMSIASLLSIKITSPITHMVSSAVRGVAASFLGVWVFHDVITSGRVASIAIIILGSIYYTWVKHVEAEQASSTSSSSSSNIEKKGDYERVPMDDIEANRRASGGKPE